MSDEISVLCDRYNIVLKKRSDHCFTRSEIELAQKQSLATLKQFFNVHASHFPYHAETNLSLYQTIRDQIIRGEIRQLRQIPLWENPKRGTIIRYLDPEVATTTLSEPLKVHSSNATYIEVGTTLRRKDRFMIARYCLVFEEIYAPWDSLKKRTNGRKLLRNVQTKFD